MPSFSKCDRHRLRGCVLCHPDRYVDETRHSAALELRAVMVEERRQLTRDIAALTHIITNDGKVG